MHESAASSAAVPAWSKVQHSLQKELEKLDFCSLWCFAYSFPPVFFRKRGINPTSLILPCSFTLAKLFMKSATCFYSPCSLQSWVPVFAGCQGKAHVPSLLFAGCRVDAVHPAGSLFHVKSSSLLTREEVTRLIPKAAAPFFLTSCSHFCFYCWNSRLCS